MVDVLKVKWEIFYSPWCIHSPIHFCKSSSLSTDLFNSLTTIT